MNSKVVEMSGEKLQAWSIIDRVIVIIAAAFIVAAGLFGVRVVFATLTIENQETVDSMQDMRIETLEDVEVSHGRLLLKAQEDIESIERIQEIQFENIQRSLEFLVNQHQPM